VTKEATKRKRDEIEVIHKTKFAFHVYSQVI
jgi:hypothetical protein